MTGSEEVHVASSSEDESSHMSSPSRAQNQTQGVVASATMVAD